MVHKYHKFKYTLPFSGKKKKGTMYIIWHWRVAYVEYYGTDFICNKM